MCAAVRAEVAASDGREQSRWVTSPSLRLQNAAPVLRSQPTQATVTSGTYRYEVQAEDPDGDTPLRFELHEAPRGMSVDPGTGVVSWPIPEEASGAFPVELAVSDSLGARTVVRYAIDLSWESTSANAQ